MILTSIRDQQPFVWARERFMAGELTIDQAIAMIMRDADFKYNAMLHPEHGDVRSAAEAVVLNVWRKELIERLQAHKRETERLGLPIEQLARVARLERSTP